MVSQVLRNIISLDVMVHEVLNLKYIICMQARLMALETACAEDSIGSPGNPGHRGNTKMKHDLHMHTSQFTP